MVLDYRVEMNAAGVIIGGAWLSQLRPDFAWRLSNWPFGGYMESLKSIYEASVKAAPSPSPEPPLIPDGSTGN